MTLEEDLAEILKLKVNNLELTIEKLTGIVDKKLNIFTKFIQDQIKLQNRYYLEERNIFEECSLELSFFEDDNSQINCDELNENSEIKNTFVNENKSPPFEDNEKTNFILKIGKRKRLRKRKKINQNQFGEDGEETQKELDSADDNNSKDDDDIEIEAISEKVSFENLNLNIENYLSPPHFHPEQNDNEFIEFNDNSNLKMTISQIPPKNNEIEAVDLFKRLTAVDIENDDKAQEDPTNNVVMNKNKNFGKRCVYCPWQKDRKSKSVCDQCKKYTCGEHSKKIKICIDCLSKINN